MLPPTQPKVYHIVHVDRLPSIVSAGGLVCDAAVGHLANPGTIIGIAGIKERRLKELRLASHPDLHVGDCVPFYFCPRSVMLYLIFKANRPELPYRDGQEPIIHLEADFFACVRWAEKHGHRWAFTLSNAGTRYFEDRCNVAHLDQIDWRAVHSSSWSRHMDEKQAEFLVEGSFPLDLVERIGVLTPATHQQVAHALPKAGHRPPVEIRREWYYQ